MNMQALALAALATASVGGVAWVFLYPVLSGDRERERRRASIAKAEPPRRSYARVAAATTAPKLRREQVEEALRDIEARKEKINKPPLAQRISRAGLSWSKNQFIVGSAIFGTVVFAALYLTNMGLPVAAMGAFAAGFGLPRWVLSFLKKRREAKFLHHFPDAIDVITRGIKAGLPLLDSMKVIVADSPEPVRSEVRALLETQAIGIPLGEACGKLYESIPVAEANFFGIVISIQQKAGGNLSEALGNLSKVLRDRKKMKGKITAMSQEAKASAAIIGALPIAVMTVVYIVSPDYISLLWTEPVGRMMMACSAFWMSCGVFVMKKMINFDF